MTDEDAVTTALYEIEGAVRGAATDVIVGHANWSREAERERTAAIIFAALVIEGDKRCIPDDRTVARAVRLADALRAELAKVPR